MHHRPGTPNQNPSRRLPNFASSPAPAAHDHGGAAAYQTALRGASLAFQRTGPSSNNNSPKNQNNNGALLAATSRMSRQTTGNSSVQDGSSSHGPPVDHKAVSQRLAQAQTGQQQQQHHYQHHLSPKNSSGSLLKPSSRPTMANDPRATSFIAATLAASRSASPSPSQLPHAYPTTTTTKARRKNSAASSAASLDLATDTTPIPPTNALISMFEKSHNGDSRSRNTDPVKKGPKQRPSTPPAVASSPGKPDASPFRMASTLARDKAASPPASITGSNQDIPGQAYAESLKTKRKPPTPPTARILRPKTELSITKSRSNTADTPRSMDRSDTVILSPQPRRAASHRMVQPPMRPQNEVDTATAQNKKAPPPAVKPKPRPQSMHETMAKPIPIKTGARPVKPPARRRSSASSNDSFVSASSVQTSIPSFTHRAWSPGLAPELPPKPPRQTRPTSSHSLAPESNMKRRSPVPPLPRRTERTSNAALTSLADATMAGILASSRAPPPSSVASSPRPPSVPPPRKQTPKLRQTLRKPPSDSSDEESKWKARHRTKPLQSKKKHSHHEGARRRWREEITERERRRYEGVWASNRGYLVNYATSEAGGSWPGNAPNDGDLVVNVAVRDLWSRSRLPVDELAEVWDVVDQTGRGMLDKTQFVVGMWLIDQRLRGRKIPQKVTDSVWASAKGVSVRGPPKDKKMVKHHHPHLHAKH